MTEIMILEQQNYFFMIIQCIFNDNFYLLFELSWPTISQIR